MSDTSSLQDMSDIELTIEQTEVDELSEDEHVVDEDGTRVRRRRRRCGGGEGEEEEEETLDEGIILDSKRSRVKVDYKELNESMFGEVSETAKSELDDEDEFQDNDDCSLKSESSTDTDDSANDSSCEE